VARSADPAALAKARDDLMTLLRELGATPEEVFEA
jgi:hypothetical protein